MTPKEIAILLVQHGIRNQQSSSDSYTDANNDEGIRSCGNGKIAKALEFLSGHDIVSDVLPVYGAGGVGFSYLLNPQFVQEVAENSSALQRVEALFEVPATETSTEITKLLDRCKSSRINEVYSQDLVASLMELKICFSQDCYIACLALSGKILEVCLKQLLFDNDKK